MAEDVEFHPVLESHLDIASEVLGTRASDPEDRPPDPPWSAPGERLRARPLLGTLQAPPALSGRRSHPTTLRSVLLRADLDLAGLGGLDLRQAERQDPVLVVRRDLLRLDRLGHVEGPGVVADPELPCEPAGRGDLARQGTAVD